jgi:chemotaxis protein methyltransferase WspC
MSLGNIESLLSQKIGISPQIIGSGKIAKVARDRQLACDLPSLESYCRLLQQFDREWQIFIEQIVVPETWFFRDRRPFDFLANIQDGQDFATFSSQPLRLLSVPCSTGEEPYSMAIALFEAGLSAHQFTIDAIDISQQAIAKAKRGIYTKRAFRGEQSIRSDLYFQPTPEGYQTISPVRQTIKFYQGNLLDYFPPHHPQYHIIFCRNLLIYLEQTACTQVFNILDRLLLPNGLLFIGAAEAGKIPSDRFISIRQPLTFAYRKTHSTIFPPPNEKIKPSFLPVNKNSSPLPESLNSNPKPSLSQTQQSSNLLNRDLDLARQLADRGKLDEALNHCQNYLSRHNTHVEVYLLMGILHQAKRENPEAERYFQKALYLNPHCYEALISLSLLKENRGDLIGAERLKQRVAKMSQTSP